jgi:hypothetical protein
MLRLFQQNKTKLKSQKNRNYTESLELTTGESRHADAVAEIVVEN